jgi:hypothetical protein
MSYLFTNSISDVCVVYTVTRRVPLVEQELLTLSKHMHSTQWGLCYSIFNLLCNMFVLFLALVLAVLRFMDSDCPFGILKLFLGL